MLPPRGKAKDPIKNFLYDNNNYNHETKQSAATLWLSSQKQPTLKPLTKGTTPNPNQTRTKSFKYEPRHPTKRTRRQLRTTLKTNLKGNLYLNTGMPQQPQQPTNTNTLPQPRQLYPKQISHLWPPTLHRQRPRPHPRQTTKRRQRNIRHFR